MVCLFTIEGIYICIDIYIDIDIYIYTPEVLT